MVTVLQIIYNENKYNDVLQIIYAVAVSNRNNCSNDAMVTIAGAVTICDYHCKKNPQNKINCYNRNRAKPTKQPSKYTYSNPQMNNEQ